MRAIVAFALLAVLLGCSSVAADPPGIDRAEAIRLAQQHAGPTAVFVSATPGTSAGWGPENEAPVPAWIVTFSGDFPMECPQGEPPVECPAVHTAVVVIDASNGRFISATFE